MPGGTSSNAWAQKRIKALEKQRDELQLRVDALEKELAHERLLRYTQPFIEAEQERERRMMGE